MKKFLIKKLITAQLHKNLKVLIVGAGQMAQDYLKVLTALGITPDVVCRSEVSSASFFNKTGLKATYGGLENYFDSSGVNHYYDLAIVAVEMENLFPISKFLLNQNIKQLLIEKPGSIYIKELEEIEKLSNRSEKKVFIAYNRRFYSSTAKAKEIIEKDGGVTSFIFEFTEWSHVIKDIDIHPEVKERWFLGNSSHLVDLAFHLGGLPEKMQCYYSGENKLSWHPSASIFFGSGISKIGALFSYSADWTSSGSWKLEILTRENRLIFKPLEKLQIQSKGSIESNFIDIDDKRDREFKPGLFKLLESLFNREYNSLLEISEQRKLFEIYHKITNYKK